MTTEIPRDNRPYALLLREEIMRRVMSDGAYPDDDGCRVWEGGGLVAYYSGPLHIDPTLPRLRIENPCKDRSVGPHHLKVLQNHEVVVLDIDWDDNGEYDLNVCEPGNWSRGLIVIPPKSAGQD